MDIIKRFGTDVSKSMDSGSVVFKVGPFHDKSEAEELMEALKALGSGDCRVSDQ